MNNTPAIARHEFFQQLNHFIGDGSDTATGLVLIDVCNLKRINRNLGHEFGDAAVCEVYQRLSDISKLPNTLFRVSGHRFAFILPGMQNYAFLMLANSRIQSVLADGVYCQDKSFDLETETGICITRPETSSAYACYDQAEISLQKARAGIPHSEHMEDLQDVSDHPLKLEEDFRRTLAQNGLELYYQPKLNLLTQQVDKAEALLRWRHPEHGFISPEVAVNIAGQLGEQFALTKWVMHSALRQARQWLDQQQPIGIAVNICADLVSNDDLVQMVHDALAIWGVPGELLILEITESAVIKDKESGQNNLLRLRDLGITISIDDFGTGYSSLSYFKDLPANELKIDKSFVMSMPASQRDRDIVALILDMARLFELNVVAEGIEDSETLSQLHSWQCQYAQGYFISRPLPADEFTNWLSTWPEHPAHALVKS